MKRILIQLDTDPLPSSFDRVVAVDCDVDHLFSYGGVTPQNVTGLVHGAIFTRGPKDLANTALFIGGSDVAAGEALLQSVNKAFAGPFRTSVLMDSNGSNTTAAAAVLCARKHVPLSGASALVLAGTGPVGQRAAQLLAAEKANVKLASRTLERSEKTAASVRTAVPGASVTPVSTGSRGELEAACQGVQLIIAAGAAGIELLPAELWTALGALQVVIDLNAYPPLGIGGVEVMDKAVTKQGKICYGAIGVGGLKMKIHKAAVKKLFESNDQTLDTAQVYELGATL